MSLANTTSSSLPLRFLLLLLLLLLAVPRLGRCEEDGGQVSEQEDQTQKQQEEEEGKQHVVVSYSDNVQQKYVVVWADAPPKATRESSSRENFNFDITSVNCTSDDNCTAELLGLDLALSYPSDLPSSPYCECE
ncbi:hypothetical protein Pcinc_036582 [Petrolisthes cinctipes]|uniref:Uncharacterized protein n=1 Tax=Petrolisthes cinctipes TaxID=88211 RepID=A0AAE1EPG7_PETCI|nr:hypothetical protein Pcinc_036582 [Petrolisthes cinctipes]